MKILASSISQESGFEDIYLGEFNRGTCYIFIYNTVEKEWSQLLVQRKIRSTRPALMRS